MRPGKILAKGLAVGIQVFALAVLVQANSACSCEPPAYREVDLAAVPPRVLEKAHSLAPGLEFERAWKYTYDSTFDDPEFQKVKIIGYVLRVRVHWYETRDVDVDLWSLESRPEDLQPVE